MQKSGFSPHDHAHCIRDGVEAMEQFCSVHKLQFTPVRRRVLEFLLQEHRAVGAYEILDFLRAEGFSAQPPVAYRALEFLVKHGAAHKVEKLNAFIACTQPGIDHVPAFMICRGCDTVAETEMASSNGVLSDVAAQVGFEIEKAVVEAEGLCPSCQHPPAAEKGAS